MCGYIVKLRCSTHVKSTLNFKDAVYMERMESISFYLCENSNMGHTGVNI
jgi:hypothetical protein